MLDVSICSNILDLSQTHLPSPNMPLFSVYLFPVQDSNLAVQATQSQYVCPVDKQILQSRPYYCANVKFFLKLLRLFILLFPPWHQLLQKPLGIWTAVQWRNLLNKYAMLVLQEALLLSYQNSHTVAQWSLAMQREYFFTFIR